MLVRRRELGAHDQRLDPAGEEEDRRRAEIQQPDPLVVDGRQPAEHAGPRQPDALESFELGARPRRCGDRHQWRWSR